MVPEQYDWLAKDLAAVNRQLALKYTGGGNAGWILSQTGNSTSVVGDVVVPKVHFPTKIREQKNPEF